MNDELKGLLKLAGVVLVSVLVALFAYSFLTKSEPEVFGGTTNLDALSLTGNLSVGGTATLTGGVTVNTLTASGAATMAGGLTVGLGETAITAIKFATSSVGFSVMGPSDHANACTSTANIVISGAADGDPIALGVPWSHASNTSLVFSAHVTSTGVAIIKACNVSGTTSTAIGADQFNMTVFNYD